MDMNEYYKYKLVSMVKIWDMDNGGNGGMDNALYIRVCSTWNNFV